MTIFKYDNNDCVNTVGTHLQGYVQATYEDLCEKFGEPTYFGGDKTNAEWTLEFHIEGQDEPVIATIYDWKLGDIPKGSHAWHIGGHTNESVECVHSVMQ